MAVDTPARIAVLGAGPIGLEAALYGRFLGYDVDVYERGRVAENLLRWGHVQLFTPWRWNVTPLGVAALAAQDTFWRPADDDALLTGRELAERYLVPLAHSDLLADSIHEQTDVLSVSREPVEQTEAVDEDEGNVAPFALRVQDAAGRQRVESADVVIDCTGSCGQHACLGADETPVSGETELAARIERGLLDLSKSNLAAYTGRRVLVIGAGHSAATNVVALAGLDPRPSVTWLTRRSAAQSVDGPVRRVANDPLPLRDRLARAANQLASAADRGVRWCPETSVARVAWDEARDVFLIGLVGAHSGEREFEIVVANVGYRPQTELHRGLNVHLRPLDDSTSGPQSLLQAEPDFYILGAKSYGGETSFLLSIGHRQVRDLFTIIGDRAELDLYRSVSRR